MIYFEFLFIIRTKQKIFTLYFSTSNEKKIYIIISPDNYLKANQLKWLMSLSAVPLDEPICPTRSSWRRHKAPESLSWKHTVHTGGLDGNLLYAPGKTRFTTPVCSFSPGNFIAKAILLSSASLQIQKTAIPMLQNRAGNILYCHSQLCEAM